MRYLIFLTVLLFSTPLLAQDVQYKGIEIDGQHIRIEKIIGTVITIKVNGQTRNYRVSGYLPIEVTAYTSDRRQTDRTPCIPAAWKANSSDKEPFNLCKHNREDVIAINGIDFWTKVLIDSDRDGYLEVKTVVDRMSPRFNEEENPLYRHVDLWMRRFNDAKAYGRQHRTMFFLQRVRRKPTTLARQ
jgi:hypothetical protein